MSDTDDKYKELIERGFKMSYWLGFVYSGLQALVHDHTVAGCQKDAIRVVLEQLHEGLDGIFYQDRDKYEITLKEK